MPQPNPLWTPHPPEEVIRPQVPLRPPCYDFAPLGGPRLVPPPPGGLPRGARGLAEGPLGWRDGRCVQGAGTYSPRVGDTRLLGIPRSRGRVAALDPYWGGVYGIASPFRGRHPLSPPLQLACSPGVSGHTDLPWPPPSSGLRRQSPQCAPGPEGPGGNWGRGSRSLPDLTGHLTARADDGHAPPLSSSGKVVSLAFILLSPRLRFPALTPIKPQASPLVVPPRQFL